MPSRSTKPVHAAGTSSSPSPVPASGFPASLSAERLHALCLRAFRTGNRGRLSLCETLRVLSETRLYLDLGFPSLSAYADAHLQLRRAETFEYVRVANALVELTELREAFGHGKIGWSALKAVSRVATVASQKAWIDFARRNGVERTLAEARDALRRGRDAPRDDAFGLPNLDQKLVLRFSRSDMDKVREWIESTCSQIVEKTGSADISVEEAILFLCERAEASCDEPHRGDGPRERRAPHRAQIVYQQCPGCRRARMGTRDGFVEVEPAELERYEGSAEPVVIDGPTPARMRRTIVAREGGRCGNPRCHHRADHCHHIVFRSRGGKTEPTNEVAVCATCHALIHAGLLRVYGNAAGDLRWVPGTVGNHLEREVATERAVADRLPVLQLVEQGAAGTRASAATEESAIADSGRGPARGGRASVADRGLNLEDLVGGLMRLGVPALRSRNVIDAAIRALPTGEITEAAVLRRAVASI